jgi:hypothetical protein
MCFGTDDKRLLADISDAIDMFLAWFAFAGSADLAALTAVALL